VLNQIHSLLVAVVEVIKGCHILLIVEELTDDGIILEPRGILCNVESPIISEVFRDAIFIFYLRSRYLCEVTCLHSV
jgi:hypothetical protein